MFYFQVWASVPPWKQGSLAEFVTLTEFEVSTAVILMVSILFIHRTFELPDRYLRPRKEIINVKYYNVINNRLKLYLV